MDMIAVTIGAGEPWLEMARAAADRMTRCTGLPAEVLTAEHYARYDLRNPCFLRMHVFDLLDVENVLYFDADVVGIEPWDPGPYADREAIVGCREDDWDGGAVRHRVNYHIPFGQYMQAGWFIANRRHHRRVFERALKMMWSVHSPLMDQVCLNLACKDLGVPLHFLHRRYNWLYYRSPLGKIVPVVNGHMATDQGNLTAEWTSSKDAVMADLRDGLEDRQPFAWDDELHAEVAGRYWLYCRIGYDERTLELRDDGTVGEGGRWQESVWVAVRDPDGEPLLVIGTRTRRTCTLRRVSATRWEGAWDVFERMPIVLHEPEVIEQPKIHRLPVCDRELARRIT